MTSSSTSVSTVSTPSSARTPAVQCLEPVRPFDPLLLPNLEPRRTQRTRRKTKAIHILLYLSSRQHGRSTPRLQRKRIPRRNPFLVFLCVLRVLCGSIFRCIHQRIKY